MAIWAVFFSLLLAIFGAFFFELLLASAFDTVVGEFFSFLWLYFAGCFFSYTWIVVFSCCRYISFSHGVWDWGFDLTWDWGVYSLTTYSVVYGYGGL
jgi:hypothetical protein